MKKFLSVGLVLCLLLCGCSKNDENENLDNSTDEDISYANTSEMDFTFTNRDENSAYDSKPLEVNDSVVEITKEGTYLLSGTYTSVNVNVSDSEKVQIVLDNATIKNSAGPAICIEAGDKVFITLAEGSKNVVSDGSSYELVVDDSTVDGAIFSKSDLTINGSGSLEVNGNLKHGIVSKDDLVVVDSTLNITSNGVGLDGKDCVKVKNATLNINATSDGIRSDNSEDENRGYVYIESGTLNIEAGNDGIQAETVLKIVDGTFNIQTGIGSSGYLSTSDESYKGLKAVSDILISNGSFTIDSQDDCIHSNNTLSISKGTFELSSGDDGIHADTDLLIAGGNINITKSYEGIEASVIKITGGVIEVVASDDGLNAAGGTQESTTTASTTSTIMKTSTTSNKYGGPGGQQPGGNMGGGDRPGMGNFTNSYGEIYITGGYIYLNASGDGVDSNGIVEITGGITLVSGPTNNGNAAFDYENSASVNGGTLIALGSSGMAQSVGSDDQGVLGFTMGTQGAGTSLVIVDEDGNLVISITGEKQYQCAVISSPDIKSGDTYTVIVGATVKDADEHGYSTDSSYSGGTELGSLSAQ